MTALSAATLERFVTLAAERLRGDWVVLGGAVLPLLGVEQRITVDIDIAGPETATNQEALELMRIADELGLAVESINQAAAFFLHRMPNWEKQLRIVKASPNARILRPNVTLFVLLKLERLSESDLLDCVAMLKIAADIGDRVDAARILAAIAAQEARAGVVESRALRLAALREACSGVD